MKTGEVSAMRAMFGHIVSDLKTGLGMGGDAARPAWPVLILLQLLILVGIGVTAWRLSPSAPEDQAPVLERLSALDVDGAEDSVQRALRVAESPLALEESDQRDLASFLARSAQEIDLDWVGVEFELGSRSDEIQTVIARLTLRGSPFLVPVFLAGLEDYPALGVVERFEAQHLGEDGDLFRLDISYTRPPIIDTEWVGDAVIENQEAEQALVDAAYLQAWRTYAEEEPLREARARAVRQAIARSLPGGLTALRQHGAGFLWTPAHGLEPLRSGH